MFQNIFLLPGSAPKLRAGPDSGLLSPISAADHTGISDEPELFLHACGFRPDHWLVDTTARALA
jgi:hypothetical protein